MSTFSRSLEKYAKILDSLLYFIGHLPKDSQSDEVSLMHMNTVTFICLISFALGVYNLVIAWPNDIEQIAYNATPTLASVLIIAKLITFAILRKRLRGMLDTIKNTFWNLDDKCPEREKTAVETYARYVYYSNAIQSVLICSAGPTFMLTPVIQMFIAYKSNGDFVQKILPFKFRLPFGLDVYAHPFYEIVYLIESLMVAISMISLCALDCAFVHFVLNICGQFKLLQTRIRYFDECNGISAQKTLLYNCVQHHQQILQYCKDLVNYLTFPLIVQLFEGTLFLCCAGFIVTMFKGNAFIYMQSALCLMACSCQLFTHCFAADLLTTQSLKVADAAYESKWYEAPISIQKIIFMIIMRSQKPVYITAGNFATFSIETYAMINRTAMSYFTVLTSIKE